jgi:ACS family hexuronate transporter-like MFS transporter
MNSRFTIPKLRWLIAGLLLAVTLLNYVDRLTVSVLVKNILQDFHLTEKDYGQIVALFMVAYAAMYAVSGCIVDKLGTRVGMALFVCAWSIFQILHGLATGKWSFAVCRFGLGLAEPGSFPAAAKAIGEWFPERQRAIGVGIFNTGSVIGASVSAPLAAFVALHFGWRATFVFTGALGFFWLIFWLTFYQPPQRNRWLSSKETAELNLGETAVGMPIAAREPMNWRRVLASRVGFMLVVARFLTDPVIYFVMFWLPAYLEKERGFDLKMIGDYTWIPWAVGGGGYIFGGWLSGRLVRAGWKLGRSRKTAMTVGALLLPVAILAPLAPTAGLAIAAMCVVVLGHAIWVTNLMTLPADLFPPDAVAKAAGFSGMGGAIAGALANWFTGSVVAHFSYLPIFICASLLHPISMFLVWKFLPERFFPNKNSFPPATA